MEEFLLLGQVPGTSITITFGTWLLIAGWLAVISLAYHTLQHRKQLERRIANSIVTLSMRYLLR